MLAAALVAVTACSGPTASLERIEPSADTATTSAPAPAGGLADGVALLGERGHLGAVRDGRVLDAWQHRRVVVSPDRTVAVTSAEPDQAVGHQNTPVTWIELPSGEPFAEVAFDGYKPLAVDAVAERGEFVALTNREDEPTDGQIAGAKSTTFLLVASPDGVVFDMVLGGNFVVEAFGRRIGENGLPAQLFLLEYFPADDPAFYRVRVVSTETRQVSLPLNLRNKVEQVDERMAGVTRSQVVADAHGLLFTLYRGTIDGTPGGEPYAFVHTLDLADGVWCLDVDPALELDHVDGSLAVGGDRLYVASANGHVGSFPIPSITDPQRSPTMDWVVEVGPAGDEPPVLLADAGGVWVGTPDDEPRLLRLTDDGESGEPIELPGSHPTALAFDADAAIAAVGDGWSTLGEVTVPDWFGRPVGIVMP